MKFGVLEVGSTNTKAFLYNSGELIDKGRTFIPFKNHYKAYGSILKEDIETLKSIISSLLREADSVYAYGTSIFRTISKEELALFLNEICNEHVTFQVVTSEDENRYTVEGVLADISYEKDMVVVIGGGGSTEVALVQNQKIVRMHNLSFGAMDITDAFPDLQEDITNTSFDEMLHYTASLCKTLEMKADIMVLAGGDYLYFYETVGYKMEKNTFYEDQKQPYKIPFSTFDIYDHDILTKSLDDIKKKCVGNESWWNGARGMRFCMNAIARQIGAKYIIPTRINMLYGIVQEIINRKSEIL